MRDRVCVLLLVAACLVSTRSVLAAEHLRDAFETGWMVVDTNSDGIADAVAGKIVVPVHPTAAENAAAANFAARIGYATTGLTLPIVVTTAIQGPRIWIGKTAVPAGALGDIEALLSHLEKDEGGVFAAGGNLAVIGFDDNGLLAAADAFTARAPYLWKIPGDRMAAIEEAVGNGAELIGVTYVRGKPGIRRAFVRTGAAVGDDVVAAALSSSKLSSVAELIVVGGGTLISVVNPKSAAAPVTTEAAAAAPPAAGAPQRLDLATLFTSKGLFSGTAKMPVPSTLESHLYTVDGAAGIAMANLAARMGLETTGIALPLASPAGDTAGRSVRMHAVLAGDSRLSEETMRKLRTDDTASNQAETVLSAGEGELRVVDDAFGRRSAILVGGDPAGSAAAIDLLSGRFPNLWEPGKQYLSLEEIRYDLHRFFSLRSGVGQAAMVLHHLERW